MPAFERQQNRIQGSHLVSPTRLDQAIIRPAHSENPLTARQQVLGNQAVQRLLRSRAIQAKLTINEPGDRYEQEADRVAEQVMRMPEPGASLASGRGALPKAGNSRAAPPPLPIVQRVVNGNSTVQRCGGEAHAGCGCARGLMSEEPDLASQSPSIQRLLRSRAIQAKLTINEPGDQYEQEADRVAERVMRMLDLSLTEKTAVSRWPRGVRIQRMCPGCEEELHRQPIEEEDEEETLQTKEVPGHTPEVTPDVQAQVNPIEGGGQPLPQSVRAFFEPRFGHDFSQVRIHTDGRAAESANAVHSLAYTVGRDIVFGAGRYAPETLAGRRLVAHELTHILQQRNRSAWTPHVAGRPFVLHQVAGGVSSVQRITGEELTSGTSTGASSSPADVGQQLLSIGSVGPAVALLQDLLNRSGIAPEPLDVDGIFGPRTEAAVVTFQAAQGLEPDGIVGPLTNAKLAAVGGPEPPPTPALGEVSPPRGEARPSPPPLLASGCPPYSKAELDASRDSGGRFDQPSAVGPTVAQQALMWDFEQGQAVTRQGHIAGALKMVIDLGLNTTAPSATIAIILGHTDCVDKESVNSPLRAGRANAARELFKDVGAREEHIGPAEPATQGPVPGDDSTAIGRARNRSAAIIMMPPPKRDGTPPEPKPRKRRCNANADLSQHWSLQDVASATIAGSVGVGLFTFVLKNCESGCEYECLFVGFGGGLALGVSISAPGSEPFTTPEFFENPKDFQGDAGVFSASIGVGPAAVEHAFIRFRAVKTKPDEINIGGLEAGFGTEIGVIGLEGKFFVKKEGFPRAPCL